jgi:hypothetical protein
VIPGSLIEIYKMNDVEPYASLHDGRQRMVDEHPGQPAR